MQGTIKRHGYDWVSRVWIDETWSGSATYEVYEVVAGDGEGAPEFHFHGQPVREDSPTTSDLTLAAKAIHGAVRWDGSSHNYFTMDGTGYHHGDPPSLILLGDVFRHIHDEALRLMREAGQHVDGLENRP
jgi:hypothetical protein